MITLSELLSDNKLSDLSSESQTNIQILLTRINIVRAKYNKAMMVTSGVRTKAHHIEVYQDLAKKQNKTFDLSKVPMGSKHLIGAAVDILDKNQELYNWLKANPQVLIDAQLWCEEDLSQPRVHFQIFPPKSGARWFKP